MDLSLFASLLDSPILFFVFGLFAVLVGSNLEIPQQITKFLSLYLLMAIGFKGGVALAATGITQVVVFSLLAAAIMALAVLGGRIHAHHEAMRPMLKRFGGVCLVSDAQWVIH